MRIYLDLDETLVLTERLAFEPKWKKISGAKQFEYPNREKMEKWVSFLRPGACAFINACQSLAPTAYLTSGGSQFQSRVVALHQMPVLPVIGSEFYNTIPPADHALLVDNYDILTCGVQDKLRAILQDRCLPGSRNITAEEVAPAFTLLQAPIWHLPDFSDNELKGLIHEVRAWHLAGPVQRP